MPVLVFFIECEYLLPLPLGAVAERSEDGEGKLECNTLSVTCGDSSPKGRAKGAAALFYIISASCRCFASLQATSAQRWAAIFSNVG